MCGRNWRSDHLVIEVSNMHLQNVKHHATIQLVVAGVPVLNLEQG